MSDTYWWSCWVGTAENNQNIVNINESIGCVCDDHSNSFNSNKNNHYVFFSMMIVLERKSRQIKDESKTKKIEKLSKKI